LAPQETIEALFRRLQLGEQRLLTSQRICASCTGSGPSDTIECQSIDCSWLFERKRAEGRAEFLVALQASVNEMIVEQTDEHADTDNGSVGYAEEGHN
jgi:DNA polymerase zeta